MDQLNGDLLGDSDSDDQDYVPSAGESDHDEVEETPEETLPDENESQKKKTDALWADFLSDVEAPASKKAKIEPSEASSSTTASKLTDTPVTSELAAAAVEEIAEKPKELEASSSKIEITQVFDFAGEKIEVKKEVGRDSKEAKKFQAEQEKQNELSQKVLVRPKAGGGLSTIVGNVLNKKNKMSILEKSRLDWSGFKRKEGIEEELTNHNKGKGGYLEKMAFLDRTDLRQFEIEKSLREKERSSRGSNAK